MQQTKKERAHNADCALKEGERCVKKECEPARGNGCVCVMCKGKSAEPVSRQRAAR